MSSQVVLMDLEETHVWYVCVLCCDIPTMPGPPTYAFQCATGISRRESVLRPAGLQGPEGLQWRTSDFAHFKWHRRTDVYCAKRDEVSVQL